MYLAKVNLNKMASSSKDAQPKVGMKGSDVFDSTGSALVDLSVRLVRGGWCSETETLLRKALETSEDDVFVLAFQTRDIRGGKGERKLFTQMMSLLLTHRHDLVVGLLDLIPEYGCWRDLYDLPTEIRPQIVDLMVKQLTKDGLSSTPSLCAKWAPREGKDTAAAKELALRMFPTEPKLSRRLKMYRKLVADLNRRLDTTEIKMCGQHFADINPSHVPGVCLAKNMKALLNEPRSGRGLRHPDDPDRNACREHFQEHMAKAVKGEVKVNGSVTRYPHQVIKDIVGGAEGAEKDALIAVWNGMVANAKALGGLQKTIAMCDFSGSMKSSHGATPYWVSMAMGLLISEVCSDEFKDTFMTFDTTPQWHKLPAQADIFARVASIGPDLGQGLSTDFQKAMDLVLTSLKAKRTPPGCEPKDLIVVTDMAWDEACSSSERSGYTANGYRDVVKTAPWQTHIQMIREAFKRAGEDMWGEGFHPPRIVIWNVAATCSDFHATADNEGVIMLSGWSPSLFKVLTEEGARVQTPAEALRVMLDDLRYEPIRKRLSDLNTGGS